MDLVKIDQLKCKQCGICVQLCPPRVLKMGKLGPVATRPELCMACGHCVAVCPSDAIDNINAPRAKQTELKNFPVIDAQTAQDFMKSRRSTRKFKDVEISRDKIIELLDIARFAPTASNSQGISYIIIDDKKLLKKITDVTMNWMECQLDYQSHWSFPYHVHDYKETGLDVILHDAPVLIVATAPEIHKNGRENTIFSLAYLELYATALGLGSVWAGLLEMCAFSNYAPLIELFHIQENYVFTGAVMVGIPLYRFKRLVDRNPLQFSWNTVSTSVKTQPAT